MQRPSCLRNFGRCLFRAGSGRRSCRTSVEVRLLNGIRRLKSRAQDAGQRWDVSIPRVKEPGVIVLRVEIARHRAGQRTPTRPIFRGRFSQAGDRVVLAGRFAYPLSTKILSVGLIGVVAVLSTALLLFGFGAIFVGSPAGPSRWVGVAGATLGFGLIYALSKVVQPFERDDVPWISAHVQRAIGSA